MKVAILGFGTVGSGVYKILTESADLIEKKAGERIEVKYVLDLREFPGNPVEEVLVHDYSVIVNDPEVAVVVETMGGLEPAYSFEKEALLKGKSACTSNKELVAKHGAELIEIAKQKKVSFLFEASVGGGIPIIRPLNSSLTCDVLEQIQGILNGTTNYILTKMSKEGLNFDDVLKDAQDKGFAERNPAADIEGYDAARKIAILASLAYGKQVDFEDVYTEGITKITPEDIAYAKAEGLKIKLIGQCLDVEGKHYASVAPRLIDDSNPLFAVDGVYNAIKVRGNYLGDTMFYGKGAGSLPTASAVVSDVIDAVKNNGRHIPILWSEKKLELADRKHLAARFFVRVNKADEELARKTFKVDKVVALDSLPNEFAFFTKQTTEGEFADDRQKLNVISAIRA